MITLFHTNENRGNRLAIPVYARGNKQWLGDGYYFWQDYEFAEEWGYNRICKINKNLKEFDIYEADLNLDFPSEHIIDTVFNEEDYRGFLKVVELFAVKYQLEFGEKPTLEEFNDFIKDFDLWKGIKAIRFQDLPTNSNRDYLKIKNFYYKKRIQIVVYDVKVIRRFEHKVSLSCKN